MVFSTISQACQSYYDNLPDAIFPSIAKSAGYSFTIALLLSARSPEGALDLTRPLIRAGVAALASTIHALMTPLFDKIFGPSRTSEGFYELVKSCTVAVFASALVGYGVNSSIQLSAFKLYYLISSNSFTAWFTSSSTAPQRITDNSIYFAF